jgi:hypothetical protein
VDVEWIQLAQDKVRDSYDHGKDTSRFIWNGEFIKQLKDISLLMRIMLHVITYKEMELQEWNESFKHLMFIICEILAIFGK